MRNVLDEGLGMNARVVNYSDTSAGNSNMIWSLSVSGMPADVSLLDNALFGGGLSGSTEELLFKLKDVGRDDEGGIEVVGNASFSSSGVLSFVLFILNEDSARSAEEPRLSGGVPSLSSSESYRPMTWRTGTSAMLSSTTSRR